MREMASAIEKREVRHLSYGEVGLSVGNSRKAKKSIIPARTESTEASRISNIPARVILQCAWCTSARRTWSVMHACTGRDGTASNMRNQSA